MIYKMTAINDFYKQCKDIASTSDFVLYNFKTTQIYDTLMARREFARLYIQGSNDQDGLEKLIKNYNETIKKYLLIF